ncbi:MAG: CPXCG motif-containing cysteine-rich protein [Planctomycetaceae bacterium]
MQDEASYTCESCGEEIVVPVDISQGRDQRYVEDCPVCCHPNVIHLWVDDDEFRADATAE